MKTYDLYLKPQAKDRKLYIVKRNFTWSAFFCSGVWAIYYRHWGWLVVIILFQMSFQFVGLGLEQRSFSNQMGFAADALYGVGLLILLALGYNAGRLTGKSLRRRGYQWVATLDGKNRYDAWQQYQQESTGEQE